MSDANTSLYHSLDTQNDVSKSSNLDFSWFSECILHALSMGKQSESKLEVYGIKYSEFESHFLHYLSYGCREIDSLSLFGFEDHCRPLPITTVCIPVHNGSTPHQS